MITVTITVDERNRRAVLPNTTLRAEGHTDGANPLYYAAETEALIDMLSREVTRKLAKLHGDIRTEADRPENLLAEEDRK